ncbi:MAG: ATP-binding protein [Thermoplasmatales archaeon]|nr:ATP-binding protein [Thermoplasmatales archaeon]
MNVRDLLENTYYHLRKAEENLSSGNNEAASTEYYEAAKNLLDAAAQSEGELKKVRVENAEKLINMGKRAKNDAANQTARESVKPGESEDYARSYEELGVSVANVPDVTFNDVAGLEKVKEEIFNKVIYPARNASLAKEYKISPGGGLLLYGPPGTGKTFVARAISHEVNAKFVYINPSTLLSKWFGSFEKKIEQLFRLARETAPTVIFFDEIDALAPKRSRTDSSVMKRAVPQLLAEMDGFNRDRKNMVLIIGATNNPWDIDEALMRPGRFDENIFIGPPDLNARKKMFELSLKGRKISPGIDYLHLAEMTQGYTGADIDYMCRKVAEQAFRNAIENGSAKEIDQQQIEAVVGQTRKSVDEQVMQKYDKFLKNAGVF